MIGFSLVLFNQHFVSPRWARIVLLNNVYFIFHFLIFLALTKELRTEGQDRFGRRFDFSRAIYYYYFLSFFSGFFLQTHGQRNNAGEARGRVHIYIKESLTVVTSYFLLFLSSFFLFVFFFFFFFLLLCFFLASRVLTRRYISVIIVFFCLFLFSLLFL